MIRVGVAGAAGRVGAAVCEAVQAAGDMELTGRADPQLGVALADILGDCDVVVDFTTPGAALDNALACVRAGVHAVVGTLDGVADGLAHAARGARDGNVDHGYAATSSGLTASSARRNTSSSPPTAAAERRAGS